MTEVYIGTLLGPHGERVGRYVTFEDYQNEIGVLRGAGLVQTEEAERLRTALRRYGAHDKDCAWPDHECDCGFSAIKPPDEWVDEVENKWVDETKGEIDG